MIITGLTRIDVVLFFAAVHLATVAGYHGNDRDSENHDYTGDYNQDKDPDGNV